MDGIVEISFFNESKPPIYKQYSQLHVQSFEDRLLASSSLSVRLPLLLSVHREHLGSHWTDFHEISYLSIFRNSVEKIQVFKNLTIITGNLYEDQYTCFITSGSILLTMRNVPDKIRREN
jgi:hypothetical protein